MNKQQNKVTNLLFPRMNEMYKPLPESLTIKTSKVNGLGLFAKEDIPIGTELGKIYFHVSEEDITSYYHGDIIRTPLGAFGNHSDDPNCEKYSGDIGEKYIRTKRDIKVGEELVLNFGGVVKIL